MRGSALLSIYMKNKKKANPGHVSGEEQLNEDSVVNSSSGSFIDNVCSICLTLGGLVICTNAIFSLLNKNKYE